MNSSKRQSRQYALNYLYNLDLMKESDITLYNNLDDYALELVTGVNNNLKKIDDIIIKNLTNYTINRLNYVDRSIIRIAVYELMNGLAKPIVINEAIELSKIYSKTDDFNSGAFNNKLLDKISNNL